jgi:two-component system phosphate regulon sensor histidine kinase PhoR
LKLGRSLYIIITLIVVCSFFLAGLARWQNSGAAEEGRSSAEYVQHIPFESVCYAVGTVGVILLGWYWLRLAGAITSMVELAKIGRASDIGVDKEFSTSIKVKNIEQLCKAIGDYFEGVTGRIAEYEEQIKDLQLRVQLSQRREKNTEAIVYSIRDAVIVIDEFDKLLMANDVAGRLFNFNFKDSQHKLIGELISADKSKFKDFLSHGRKSKGQAKRREIELPYNGELKTFDCIISCVYDERQHICGTVAVMHYITLDKQIQQIKNDFVSHVSHELKTPLASITAYSEMLCDGEADDEQTRKEFYSVIQNQAKRLSRLIEDILNTSRIESGLIKVNKEPASLTMLIEEQLRMIRSYAEEKNIEVFGQKPIVFDQVYVHKDMISQVIVNLLSNAVKYTPPGGSVKIETEVDELEGLARVSVTDTGVGIPEDEIEHVFDKFYRVGANEKHAKGTGLGLNLVKQIIEKVHNGQVFVTSQVGVGSTFGFELPLARKEAISTS